MSSKVKKKILKLKESSTLVINEKSKELISKGKKIYQEKNVCYFQYEQLKKRLMINFNKEIFKDFFKASSILLSI